MESENIINTINTINTINIMNMEKDSIDNINEFCEIIRFLSNRELTILNQVLMLKDEKEQIICLRQMQNETSNKKDGALYNAYTARVLVSEPNTFIKNEIVFRFNQFKL